MSTSIDSVLRTARGHVISQIPELATELRNDSQTILHAVKMDIEEQGVDPFDIHWTNLNRTERQSISGFFIKEQTDFLVEGTGAEARFRLDDIEGYRKEDRSNVYQHELRLLLHAGARYVKRKYSHGSTPEERWWGSAARRYAGLHIRANVFSHWHYGEHDSFPETWFLARALRSAGLPSALGLLFDGADKVVPPESAHDLAVPAIAFAGIHMRELIAFNRASDKGEAPELYFQHHAKLKRWRLLADFDAGTGTRVIPRLPVRTARMKCPAHAVVPGEEAEKEVIDPVGTALDKLVHASINLGVEEYGLLKRRTDESAETS